MLPKLLAGQFALGGSVIDLETIEREINQLEARGDTTYAVCERLSWLYIVRDHLRPINEETCATQQLTGSDFLEACSNVSYPMLMRILDEHMSAMRIVYEKEYENVMAKIRELR